MRSSLESQLSEKMAEEEAAGKQGKCEPLKEGKCEPPEEGKCEPPEEGKCEPLKFVEYVANEELESILEEEGFFFRFPAISDKALTSLLFFYLKFIMIGQQKDETLTQILKILCFNPTNCFKIFDLLCFMLNLDKNQLPCLQHMRFFKNLFPDKETFKTILVNLNYTNLHSAYLRTLYADKHFLAESLVKFGYGFTFRGYSSLLHPITLLEPGQHYVSVLQGVQPPLCEALPFVDECRAQIRLSLATQPHERTCRYESMVHTIALLFKQTQYASEQLMKFGLVRSIVDLVEFQKPQPRNAELAMLDLASEEKDVLDKMDQMSCEEKNASNYSKEILWPNFNFEEFCLEQSYDNLQQMYNAMAQTKCLKYQPIYASMLRVIKNQPSIVKQLLSACWEDVAVDLRRQINCIFNQSISFKKDLLEQIPALNADKPLLQQQDILQENFTNYNEILSKYIDSVYNQDNFKTIYELSQKQLKQMTDRMYEIFRSLNNLAQQHFKINEMTQNMTDQLKLLKEDKKMKKSDLKKKKLEEIKNILQKKKSIRLQIISVLRNIILKQEQLNLYLREVVEYLCFIMEFFGYSSNEDNDKLQEMFNYIKLSAIILICLAYQLRIGCTDPGNPSTTLLSELSDPQSTQLYTIITKDVTDVQPETNQEEKFSYTALKHVYSCKPQDVDLRNINLQTTFELFCKKIMQNKDQKQVQQIFEEDLEDKLKQYFQVQCLKNSQQSCAVERKIQAINYLVNQRMSVISDPSSMAEIEIKIDRSKPWESTLETLEMHTLETFIGGNIYAKFQDEEGTDQGGLRNEWLTLLTQEVFHPNFGLFELSSNKRSIQPNPLSFIVPDYLTHFRYLGRLIGKALISNWQLEIHFTKSFLKHVLGRPLCIQDIDDIDPELCKNLQWVLKNDISVNDGFVFEHCQQIFDKTFRFELKENGISVPVTNENKIEFVKSVCQIRMTDSIKNQIIAFKQGINEVIPQNYLQYLTENELQMHFAGMPELNVDELEQFCEFEGYSKESNVVKYLFEVLREFDETMKANFVFFLTGSFKIPLDGFKNNPMVVVKEENSHNYPVAHTCMNQLDLPEYKSKSELEQKLVTAIM